jgi:hypothetical protein
MTNVLALQELPGETALYDSELPGTADCSSLSIICTITVE